ncbi:MAG: NADH-quinone oxidoreductase subunit J [Sulfurovaceae bacterium]|nr:NADH-quinone oxidoreductase subunit J [Sulfurovaceae bacterium]
MFEQIAFYLFSFLTIGLFLVTVFSNNILYAMTSLAAGMVLIAGFFFLNGADFLGVVQIIVYVGAVMALYAFGMMFFNVTKVVKEKNTSNLLVLFLGVSIALLMVIMFLSPIVPEAIFASVPPEPNATNPEAVGMVLFSKYLVPFEVSAVMLLIAMIGGIILAGKKMDQSLTKIEDEIISEKDVK